MHLHDLTIRTFHNGLVKKEFTALEAAEAYYQHIEVRDPSIGSYLALTRDLAMKQAEEADLKIARGEAIEPLAGVPMAIKDNMLVENEIATAGSKILKNYTAPYDATAIKKLRTAGAVFLGKTNLDEFAMGSSTENSAFKITKNPHDTTRVPGGSSGGSAAAVAAHMALAALGSDTGGSIREPASFCGVVGLKPTYGAVSRFGLIAMASSLDQIGPLARTVEDAAVVFKAIAGADSFDATSAEKEYGDEVTEPDFAAIKKLRVGIPDEYFRASAGGDNGGLEPEVHAGVEQAIASVKSLGLEFKKISLPHTKHAISTYYIVMPAEVSANLARYDGIRYGTRAGAAERSRKAALAELYRKSREHGFGAEVKRRIILGTFVLSSGYYDAYYEQAQKARRLIMNDFLEAFKEVDVILTPVAPTRAFKIGEKTRDPLAMYLSDIFTIPASLAGLPALALPVTAQATADRNPDTRGNIGEDSRSNQRESALPVGFQLIGKPWREADILGIGQFYERM